jgi:Flp pilus assembly protein TadD
VRRAVVFSLLLLSTPALAAEPAAHSEPEAAVTEPQGPALDTLVAHAQLFAVKQNWTQAEELFRAALDKDPERADAWRGLGYVLRKEGHGSDARTAYEKALELAPADPETLLGLGETYVSVGRMPDAKRLLERLRAVDKRHAATLDYVIKTGKAR